MTLIDKGESWANLTLELVMSTPRQNSSKVNQNELLTPFDLFTQFFVVTLIKLSCNSYIQEFSHPNTALY